MTPTINDVFILDYFNKRPIKFEFPQWQEDEFGTNLGQRLEKLMTNGYLRVNSVVEGLEKLTIPELKAILKTKELKVSGKKIDLINRVSENFIETELAAYWKPEYRITQLGESLLKEYELFLINRKEGYNFRIAELEAADKELKARNPAFTAQDVIWSLLNKKIINTSVLDDPWEIYTTYKHMHDIFAKRGYYESALEMIFQCWAIALSGADKNRLTKDIGRVCAYQDMVEKTEKSKLLSGISDLDFKKMALPIIEHTQRGLLFSYYNPESVYYILNEVLSGNAYSPEKYPPDNERPKELSWEYQFNKQYETIDQQIKQSFQDNTSSKKSGCLTAAITILFLAMFVLFIF